MIKRVTIILLMLIAAAAMQARDFDDIKNAMRLIDSGKDSIVGVMQRLKASEMRLRDADPVKAACADDFTVDHGAKLHTVVACSTAIQKGAFICF